MEPNSEQMWIHAKRIIGGPISHDEYKETSQTWRKGRADETEDIGNDKNQQEPENTAQETNTGKTMSKDQEAQQIRKGTWVRTWRYRRSKKRALSG